MYRGATSFTAEAAAALLTFPESSMAEKRLALHLTTGFFYLLALIEGRQGDFDVEKNFESSEDYRVSNAGSFTIFNA